MVGLPRFILFAIRLMLCPFESCFHNDALGGSSFTSQMHLQTNRPAESALFFRIEIIDGIIAKRAIGEAILDFRKFNYAIDSCALPLPHVLV